MATKPERKWIQFTASKNYFTNKKQTQNKTSISVEDWCMSPSGIAGSQDQSWPNSETKCRLARSLMLPNFVVLRQEMCKISAVKNLCSRKSGPKFTKIGDSLLYTQCPSPCQISSCSAKRCTRKALPFFTSFTILAPQGTPWSKFNNLGPYV